jgi:hypothetical protein
MKKTNLSIALAALLLVAVGAILPACQPQETELPFETIEQKDFSGTGAYYENQEPALIVIAAPQEAELVLNFITPDAAERLNRINYDSYFIIAIFQGMKPSGGYGVNITRISSRNHQITVEVNFQKPVPGFERTNVITSPYQLVQVEKPAGLEGRQTFVLRGNGNTAATIEAVLP